MDVEIRPKVFEWLLANWAGYSDNPAAIFPSLKDQNPKDLAGELDSLLGRFHIPNSPEN